MNHQRCICQDKNLTTSNREPSPGNLKAITRHLSRQKPHHNYLRTITEIFAKQKTLPQELANHHRGICQHKNLTTSTCEPSSLHLPTRKPCHKQPRAITATFAKTKTSPQASANHHRGICQDKNLTTSNREPSPGHLPRQKPYHKREHLPRQKPYHKQPRTMTGAFGKAKTLPQASMSHHRGICQDKNLTTCTLSRG